MARSIIHFGIILILSAFGVSACGGGGGGSDPVSQPPPTADTNLDWDNGNWDEEDWQ